MSIVNRYFTDVINYVLLNGNSTTIVNSYHINLVLISSGIRKKLERRTYLNIKWKLFLSLMIIQIYNFEVVFPITEKLVPDLRLFLFLIRTVY